jgi:hypothetical protein
MQTHDEAIAGLPDELRSEVVSAAMQWGESGGEDVVGDVGPGDGTPPLAPPEPDYEDRYAKWVSDVRAQARGCPTAGHVTAYRKGRLAECGQWDDPEEAEREVNDAFDAKLRQLQGGGQ